MKVVFRISGFVVGLMVSSACGESIVSPRFDYADSSRDETERTQGKMDELHIGVEVKVPIPETQIDELMAAWNLNENKANLREIYFFDSDALSHYEAGLLLRARRELKKNEGDVTVKFRPLSASAVNPTWFTHDGFKCEIDRVGSRAVSSCSFKEDTSGTLITSSVQKKISLKRAFSSDQEQFIQEHSSSAIEWKQLRTLGPVQSLTWKLKNLESVSNDVTVEYWRIGDHFRMLEFSSKADSEAEGDLLMKELSSLLNGYGVVIDEDPPTKTRAVLEYFRDRAISAE